MISNMTDLPAPEIGQLREWPKLRADRWLSLAAAPIFAVMALLTVVSGGGPVDTMCSVTGASPLGGMVPMYMLMSAFHAAPWLKLISHFRSRACRS
jgi:hypothetical protein